MGRGNKKKWKEKNKSQEFQLILSIPIDLIKIIRDYLDQRDLSNFYCTCKTFNLTNDTVFQERFIRSRMNPIVIEKLLMFDTSNIEQLEKMKRIYGKFIGFRLKFESDRLFHGFYNKDGNRIYLCTKIYGNQPEENSFRYRYESSINLGFELYFRSYGQENTLRPEPTSCMSVKFLIYGQDRWLPKLDPIQYIIDIHQFRTLKEYHKHVRECLEIYSLTNVPLARFMEKIMEEIPMEKIFEDI